MKSIVSSSLALLLVAGCASTSKPTPSAAPNPPAAAVASTPSPAPAACRPPAPRPHQPRRLQRCPPPPQRTRPRQPRRRRHAPGGGGGGGRGGPPPPPPTPPPAVMPAPVTPIVSDKAPSPDPRIGLSAGRWDAGQAAWNLKLVSTTPPAPKFLGITNSDLRVHRQVRDPGQLQRLPDLRHVEAREAGDGAVVRLPGVTERRLGLQEPAVRVGRRSGRPRRLRHPGRARTGQQGSAARHPHLRYLGHGESEVPHQRADLPRLAHAHGRDRSARQGQRLHLRVGLGGRPLGRRASRLLRRRHRRSEDRAVPHRGDQGAARRATEGRDRQLAAHLQRPRAAAAPRRAAEGAGAGCAGQPVRQVRQVRRVRQVRVRQVRQVRQVRRRRGARARRRVAVRRRRARSRTGRSAARSESVPRHHRLSRHRVCRRRVRRLRPAAQHPRSRQPAPRGRSRPTSTCRSGTRRRSATTARRCSSPTSGAAARRRAAARPTSRSGAPTRSSPIENGKMRVQELLQAPGAADLVRELRRAQRIAHSDSRPRSDGAGLVSGRHHGVRLDRPGQADGDCATSIAARSTARASSWAARGRCTGTTA